MGAWISCPDSAGGVWRNSPGEVISSWLIPFPIGEAKFELPSLLLKLSVLIPATSLVSALWEISVCAAVTYKRIELDTVSRQKRLCLVLLWTLTFLLDLGFTPSSATCSVKFCIRKMMIIESKIESASELKNDLVF